MSILEAATRISNLQAEAATSNTEDSSYCNSSLSYKFQEKKLLVLDLDETLVHTIIHTRSFNTKCDFSFTDEGLSYYIKKRPYLQEFLKRASELFHLVIFTAGEQTYADPILDFLDPQHKLIAGRFYRDSVVFDVDNDNYLKDLTIFRVDLAKIILVDNCPQNFCLQKENGIPIISWYSDPHDEELSTLLPFLEMLADAEDVRPVITERFSRCMNDEKDGAKLTRKKQRSSQEVGLQKQQGKRAKSCIIRKEKIAAKLNSEIPGLCNL